MQFFYSILNDTFIWRLNFNDNYKKILYCYIVKLEQLSQIRLAEHSEIINNNNN